MVSQTFDAVFVLVEKKISINTIKFNSFEINLHAINYNIKFKICSYEKIYHFIC